jgi:hypothetical protein
MDDNTYNPLQADNFSLGAYGFVEATGAETAPAGYCFGALVSDIDATYAATTVENGDNLTSQARAAGQIRLGRFSVCTVSAGTVLCYLAKL